MSALQVYHSQHSLLNSSKNSSSVPGISSIDGAWTQYASKFPNYSDARELHEILAMQNANLDDYM